MARTDRTDRIEERVREDFKDHVAKYWRLEGVETINVDAEK